LKLHQLQDFLAVAERGSLHAAARHLGKAQPSISRSIRDLEKDLGTVLFERQAKGAVLTATGRAFLMRATVATQSLKQGREEIEQLQGEESGSVAVCLSVVAHMALLPEVLVGFRRRYPKVKLSIVEGAFPSVEASLKDGRVDLYAGLAPGRKLGSEFAVAPLFENTRLVVGRVGHPLANATSLAELVDAPWFATSTSDKPEGEVANLFASFGLRAPVVVGEMSSTLTGMIILSHTDALAIVPRQWTTFEPTRNLVQKIPVKELMPAPPMVMVRRAAMPLTPAAEYFCDLMLRASAHLMSEPTQH
jgi:LysR family transcriptional regulator, regulator of abg operon